MYMPMICIYAYAGCNGTNTTDAGGEDVVEEVAATEKAIHTQVCGCVRERERERVCVCMCVSEGF